MNNNELTSHATIETLWSVLSKYSVIIPRMQRDYAQGRETLTATRIRSEFLKDIFDTLRKYANGDKEKSLDLNFIYGNVNSNNDFFPIDGQQRLTTLFLLYWYLASFANQGILANEDKAVLSKFRYQSREVSESFCIHLINDVCIDVSKDINLKELIRDYYWFYGDYDTDPTISSMLVMLSEIDKTSKSMDDKNLVASFYELLKTAPDLAPIRFLFLDLEDIGMTDSIYIKMNARGKPLTPFENFKAQLLTYLNRYQTHLGDDFIDSVNGEWSNFFWKCSEEMIDGRLAKSAEKMDDCMMRFFRFMMQMEFIINGTDYVSKLPGTKDHNVRTVYTKLEQEDEYSFVAHLFDNEFASVSGYSGDNPIITGNLFKKIQKLLKVINKENGQKNIVEFSFVNSEEFGKKYIDDSDLFLRMIGASAEKKFTATDQIKLFAELAFLIRFADDELFTFEKRKELNRWMRYIHNLSANTESSSKEHFCYSINNTYKKLSEINDDASNIMDCIADDELIIGDNSGYQKEQAKEEKVKANLLREDYLTWSDLISEAENTNLDGEIQCLLDFSAISDKKYSPEKFANYAKKMKALFGGDYSREISGRVLRALLSVNLAADNLDESFLFTKKTNFNFWSNRIDGIGNESDFRRFLRDDNRGKRITLKTLLDQMPDEIEDVNQELDKIITLNMNTADSINHVSSRYKWMSILAKDPDILNSLEPKGHRDAYGFVFKHPCRYIRTWEMKNPTNEEMSFETVFLLEKTVINSNHRELFTYELYLQAKRKNLDVSYKVESSVDMSNCLQFTDKNQHLIQVTFEWYTNGEAAFLAKDFTAAEGDLFASTNKAYMGSTMEKALNYIENNII